MLGFWPLGGQALGGLLIPPQQQAATYGGHYGALPRKRKWRKVETLEALDMAIRETMRPDLIVLKDGTMVPVFSLDEDDDEILLLM